MENDSSAGRFVFLHALDSALFLRYSCGAMPSSDTYFTPENAREMSAKGHVARALRQEIIRETVRTIMQAPGDDYTARRLVRVRLQLDSIDGEIVKEQEQKKPDAKRLKELIEAQTRLNLQERELSMRPAPGTTKPAPDRKPRAGSPTPLPEPEDG